MKKKLFYIFLFLLLPCLAFGTDYQVTQSGAGDPISVSQFNALSGDYSDDTFYFSGTINDTIIPQVYGTSGHPVELDGYQTNDTAFKDLTEASGRCLIDLNDGSGEEAIDINGEDYITIEDFEMTDADADLVRVRGGSHDIIVKRSFFHTSDHRGLLAENGVYNLTIGGTSGHGNVFKNLGTTTAHGDIVFDSCHDIIVSYNHLYSDSSARGVDGIVCLYTYDVLVEYNSIHGHNYTADEMGENAIDLKKSTTRNWIIRFNDMYDHDYQSNVQIQSESHDVYVYCNSVSEGENGINVADAGTDDIYIFSNIVYNNEEKGIGIEDGVSDTWVYNNTLGQNGDCVTHEGEGECRSPGSSADWGNLTINGGTCTTKNNILYKSRPDDNNYQQVYIGTGQDETTTSDYNWYYWPSQTSTIRWGSAGSRTVDQVQAGSGDGLPQEEGLLANEGDPGLTNLSTPDYTIVNTDSDVYDAGVDIRSSSLAAIVIQGTTYTVRGDEALGVDTVFPGDGTIPTIDLEYREDGVEPDGWDIGAYIYGSGGAETDAPTPDPATWSVEPVGDSTTTISMTATTGSDVTPPISYSFDFDPDDDNCNGAGLCSGTVGTGGSDSGWQSADATFTDDTLQLNKCYCYSVQMKDSLGNTGTASAAVKAVTWAATPGASTLGNAADTTLDITEVDENGNTAGTEIAIQCISSVPYDVDWDQKWVNDADGSPEAAEEWAAFETWDAELTITGLNVGTEYCFKAKAINSNSVETALGAEVCLSTTGTPETPPNVSAIGVGVAGVKFD